MAQKFIILQENEFIMGNVEFHSDLHKRSHEIKSGGFWQLDKERKELYLFGASTDFGPPELLDLKEALAKYKLLPKGYKAIYNNYPGINTMTYFYHVGQLHTLDINNPEILKQHKVPNWPTLKGLLSQDMAAQIETMFMTGDPDWIIDLITELDYIGPDSEFYIPEFHGVLQGKGIGTQDINIEEVYKDLKDIERKREEEERAIQIKEEEEDDDTDPAGGHGLHSHQ